MGRADFQGKVEKCYLWKSLQDVNSLWGDEGWELVGMELNGRNEVEFQDCQCQEKGGFFSGIPLRKHPWDDPTRAGLTFPEV